MELTEVMKTLESLGNERVKKRYLSQGAREPLFGVPTGEMGKLAKRVGKDQALADRLYASGNYDAMYFAGIIADPHAMTEADFDRWIDGAYFFMISDFIVAVTLAESNRAPEIASRWIESGEELRMSAGWACYEWLLGWKPDSEIDYDMIKALLDRAVATIHTQPNRTRWSMNGFVTAVGISYLPLHGEAVAAAENIGSVEVANEKGACSFLSASESIKKAEDKGRVGFKRKAVRC